MTNKETTMLEIGYGITILLSTPARCLNLNTTIKNQMKSFKNMKLTESDWPDLVILELLTTSLSNYQRISLLMACAVRKQQIRP